MVEPRLDDQRHFAGAVKFAINGDEAGLRLEPGNQPSGTGVADQNRQTDVILAGQLEQILGMEFGACQRHGEAGVVESVSDKVIARRFLNAGDGLLPKRCDSGAECGIRGFEQFRFIGKGSGRRQRKLRHCVLHNGHGRKFSDRRRARSS